MQNVKISPLSGNKIEFFLRTKDFLNTQEEFDLYYDKEWDMLVTYPIPEDTTKYYRTEKYKPHNTATKSLFDIAYNLVRKWGFHKKLNLIKTFSPNVRTVLDYGCAVGKFIEFLKGQGIEAKGLEKDDFSRKQAEQIVKDYVYRDISEVEMIFDVVTMWHVLEHIPNLPEVMPKIKNILKKGGYLFIAVPNFKSYDASYYREYWAAYDVPRHIWHFSPKAMHHFADKFGLKLSAQYPLLFDSFYVSLLSERYRRGALGIGALMNAFYIGIKSNLIGRRTGNYSSIIYVLQKV